MPFLNQYRSCMETKGKTGEREEGTGGIMEKMEEKG
jgi:hypothetical protein